MVTKIVSFGFRQGTPDTTVTDATVVSVKGFKNPYLRARLRPLTGLDAEVQLFIRDDPHWQDRFLDLLQQAEDGAGVLYLGCVGGRHRSVYLAERLGSQLGIPVEHRDLNNQGHPPIVKGPNGHWESVGACIRCGSTPPYEKQCPGRKPA